MQMQELPVLVGRLLACKRYDKVVGIGDRDDVMTFAKEKRHTEELNVLERKLAENGHVSSVGMIAYGGSLAYGLATENSDVDLRGFALPVASDVLKMEDFEQVQTMDGVDATIYSLRKVLGLLLACNPNVVELLGLRPESVLVSSSAYERLLANKDIFISRACMHTFGGYATAQLRRIENAMSRDGDGKKTAEGATRSMNAAMLSFPDRYEAYAAGDVALHLKDADGTPEIFVDFNVRDFPAHQLRGLCGELDDINKNAANLQARNRKKADKLSKHASHLVRLLRMGSELLETGEVNTYRENDRDLLLALKQGLWFSEDEKGNRSFAPEFWELLNEEEKRFNYAKENTSLPAKPDTDAAMEFLVEEHRRVVLDS